MRKMSFTAIYISGHPCANNTCMLVFDGISSRSLQIGGAGEATGWFQAMVVVCVKLHVIRPALPLKLQNIVVEQVVGLRFPETICAPS
jgi:hypothetical protein